MAGKQTRSAAASAASAAPATPVLSGGSATGNKVAPGGRIDFTLTTVDGVTYTAELDPTTSGKGQVSVEGTNVSYTAHTPEATETVKINVKANKDGQVSEALQLNVDVVVTTLATEPATEGTVEVGKSIVVTVTTNASDFNVVSGTEEHATVNKGSGNFTINGVAEGQSVISIDATAEGGAKKTIQFTVTVSAAQAAPETTLTLNPDTEVTVEKGRTTDVTVTTNATDFNVVSGTPANATVEKGQGKFTITGVAEGDSVITVDATVQGGQNKQVTLTAHVTAAAEETTLSIDPSETTIALTAEQTKDISVTTNASDFTVESKNTEIATVLKGENRFTITAVKEGEATIEVKAQKDSLGEKKVTLTVNVSAKQQQPTVNITANPESIELSEEGEATITITGDAESITARSSNETYANIKEVKGMNIKVGGLFPGKGNVIVTGIASGKQNKELTVPFIVKSTAKTELSVNPQEVTIRPGEKAVLEITSEDNNWTIESSSVSIATVNRGEKSILGVSEGDTTVIVKADTDIKEPNQVTVRVIVAQEKATAPVLTTETLEVESGKELVLDYTVVDGDTLHAEVKESNKGSVEVSGKTVRYTAHTVTADETVTIVAYTTRGNTTSQKVETSVNVTTKKSLSRPILLTRDLYVHSGEVKTLVYQVDEGAKLELVEEPSKGSAEVSGSTVVFKAPEVAVSETIKIKVKATKQDEHDSATLERGIVVLAPGESIPDTDPGFSQQDLTLDEYKQLMRSEDIEIKDKLEVIISRGPVEQRSLASKLEDYRNKMSTNISGIVDPVKGAGYNYDLLNTLLEVVNFTDAERFKLNFDLVNYFFLSYAKEGEAFHWVAIQRFDYEWTYGDVALTTYQNLVHVISSLADLSTRDQNISGIDFDLAFDKTKTLIKDKAKDNIVGYYKS